MRKISIAMTTILMAILMCLSTLFGCNLVTTNYQRDMEQVVATVQIDANAPKKIIYKKDLVAQYINHTSTEHEHGHDHGSEENLFDELVDELVQNAVFVQFAMQYFVNELGYSVTAENKWEIETYLDAEEALNAKFKAHQDINDLLDSYIDEEEKVSDTYAGDIRVVPTGAVNDTEKTKEEKESYINLDAYNPNGVVDVSTRRQAFAKLVNMLEESDLLGDGYKNGYLETTEYFNKVLEGFLEEELLNKFEIAVNKEARKPISYEDVVERYSELYEEQKAYTPLKFESAVGENFSATNPILYGQQGYGTVYHVLLKATDKMTEELKAWNTENLNYESAEYSAKRAEIFKGITAKDQRESWIYAGYDFDGVKFTGDYTLYEEESLEFKGKVTLLNAADSEKEGYTARYRVDDIQEFSLKEILALVNDYLYKGTANIPQELNNIDSATYTATDINPDFNKRLRELMFAFSGDDGETALNTYKGYVIKPEPDAEEQEEWMLEFAEEGRALIGQPQTTFKVVATDYGYHIMFVGENFNPTTYNFPTLKDFLNYQYGKTGDDAFWKAEYQKMMADWEEYEDIDNYMYVLIGNLSSTFVSGDYASIENKIITDYVSNSEVVTINKDAYSDLN